MSIDRPVIMQRLKAETQTHHDDAERHEFQRKLMKGELPKELFVANLEQIYLVHAALEAEIRANQPNVPQLQKVVKDYQFQEPYLLEDLEFFGSDPASITPAPTTKKLIETIQKYSKSHPLALLGIHYVLEGSNNGSKYIGMAVAKAFQMKPGPGLRYMDPYGENQRDYWWQFISDMGECEFTAEESELLIRSAQEMFDAIADISDDLLAPTTA